MVFLSVRQAGTSTRRNTPTVYREITLNIVDANRPVAVGVDHRYKGPFLETIDGATSKELLVRAEDVQVLHGVR